jgi:hypothetical protein
MQIHAEGSERDKQLRRKLGSLPAIEQAKGIIMSLRRCDPDTAFAELLLVSQQSDRRLRDIAVALVALVAHTGCQPAPEHDQVLDEIVARHWGQQLDGAPDPWWTNGRR